MKKKKIALETLSSFLAIALSFDEQGDQMIAKLCFSHLQLNYSLRDTLKKYKVLCLP